jgi:hypothetical protein
VPFVYYYSKRVGNVLKSVRFWVSESPPYQDGFDCRMEYVTRSVTALGVTLTGHKIIEALTG